MVYPIALNGHTLEYDRCEEYKKGCLNISCAFQLNWIHDTVHVAAWYNNHRCPSRANTAEWWKTINIFLALLKPLHWEISTGLNLSSRQAIGFKKKKKRSLFLKTNCSLSVLRPKSYCAAVQHQRLLYHKQSIGVNYFNCLQMNT